MTDITGDEASGLTLIADATREERHSNTRVPRTARRRPGGPALRLVPPPREGSGGGAEGVRIGSVVKGSGGAADGTAGRTAGGGRRRGSGDGGLVVKVGESVLSGGGTPGARRGGARGRSPAAAGSAPRRGKGARPRRLSPVPVAASARAGRVRLAGGSATQIRLTRRGRVVVVLVLAFFALAGFWLGTRAAGFAAEGSSVPDTGGLAWVEVKGGDTLWAIAGTVAGPGSDPDAVAGRIMSLNGLDSSLIRPGMRLYLPHVR
ncbi:hypothetical protein GCM10022248_70920 [Nonomuraea soli]